MPQTPKDLHPTFLLSSGCLFDRSLAECAAICVDAGFDGMELILAHTDMLDVQELQRQLGECRVISIHAPFRRWALWGGHLHAWKKAVALGNALPHTRHITLHPPHFRQGELSLFWWFRASMDLPCDMEAGTNLTLALENLPWNERSPFAKDPLISLAFLCAQKRTGMTLDTCHLGVSGYDILAAWERIPRGIVSNVHFSDASGFKEHLWPGQGDLPLRAFLSLIAQDAYTGNITLEVTPAAFAGENPVPKLRALREEMEAFFV
ncbi:MAG: sugar phosphate isomerase/epimerase family protein [Desulfoplanes sp.]